MGKTRKEPSWIIVIGMAILVLYMLVTFNC